MNPVLNKRRLPSSLRSLLTDIGPREQWTDIGPDPDPADGIILPPRGTASVPGELISLANHEQDVDVQENRERSPVCMLCKCKPSLYTCPRCNLPYCSLPCYKSPEHSSCSEDFYKESVLQELKEMGKTEAEGRKKMQEILIGLRRKAEMTDGGMESLLKKEGVLSEASEQGQMDTNINIEAVELLSRLAELQESEEDNAEELETILEKLQTVGGTEDDTENELDENNSDLDERLQELDLNRLSEEQLWGLLNKQEKEKFVGLLKHGALGGLVPQWKPWWERHEEGGKVLVEVLQEEMSKPQNSKDSTMKLLQENQSNPKVKTSKKVKENETKNIECVPPISSKIPTLSSLCSNPSPLVGFSLVNALFGYTFTLSFFNGDTESLMFELCDMILVLSEVLSSNKVFNSVHEAIDSGETLILGESFLDKDDLSAPTRAVEAVAHILTGRNREDPTGYCLSALSQLRSVLSQARAALSKEGDEGSKRQKYFLAIKKCEFLQSWVLENSHNIIILTIELWSEHSKRESEKVSLNKAKAVVEQCWKKGMPRGTSNLIKEL